MAALDYEKLGLKCGIEIHQQLEGRKLFCNCPTLIREEPPEFTVLRRLRAVVGETGEVDVAAAQEQMKGKMFVYEGYDDCCCLVELDETPPLALNSESLAVALQIAKITNAKAVDEVQVMRKTVVDGSNTTGFQRTALVAMNGKLQTSNGSIGIPTVIAEEDSCRIIREEKDKVYYRLDRLGIPLIEISTTPNIKSPEHCREVAEKIGMLLRSTGKARRGIGTIRQDVNVSITHGARVEIKGAQELRLLPKLVEYEAVRQKNLLEIEEELLKKNVKHQKADIKDVTSLFSNTASGVVKALLKQGASVLAARLEGFAGMLGREVQQGKRLGTEFSDRAKVVAGVGGLFHTDENLTKYGFRQEEIEAVKKTVKTKECCAVVFVAEQKEKARKALEAVVERANECLQGVPKEVRRVNEDGTTTYLRPMPGAARLYPETDSQPIKISKDLLQSIKVPELLEAKAERLEKLGLSKDLAEAVSKHNFSSLFEHLSKKLKRVKPAFVAETIVSLERMVKSEHPEAKPELVTEYHLEKIFDALEQERIAKEAVKEILSEISTGKGFELSRHELLSDAQLEKAVKAIVQEFKNLPLNALIGKAMERLRGKASGQKIVEMVKRMLA